MPRKVTRSRFAETDAWRMVSEAQAGQSINGHAADKAATDFVNGLAGAEFETVEKTIAGARVTLRRVVMTGPWEVVTPTAPSD